MVTRALRNILQNIPFHKKQSRECHVLLLEFSTSKMSAKTQTHLNLLQI
jgi:hypothetical protein